MKIEFHGGDQMSIVEFADKYDLTMEVHDRGDPDLSPMKYYAHFKHADTLNGNVLCGEFGNGSQPGEAIRNYSKAISGKLLVIDAMSETRREIRVPSLVTRKLKISFE
jgi:hypothetical protein